MKRFLTMWMILGLVAGGLSTAEAAEAKSGRTVEGSYDTAVAPYTSRCSASGEQNCLAIQTRAGEASFAGSARDAHGLPVVVAVWADGDGNGTDDVNLGSFCGQTDQPISFRPGLQLHFWVGLAYPYERGGWNPIADPSTTTCPGGKAATSGTMQITLYTSDVDNGGAAPEPAPGPTPSPAAEPVDRSIDLELRRHLRAVGSVVAADPSCGSDVPVVIQRKTSGAWLEIASTTTETSGAFAMRLADRPGRYRVVTPEVGTDETYCREARSATVRHHH